MYDKLNQVPSGNLKSLKAIEKEQANIKLKGAFNLKDDYIIGSAFDFEE